MLNAWVKNVNNWRVNTSTNHGYINTVLLNELQIYITKWVQQPLSLFIPTYSYTTLSTTNNTKFNLLNNSYTTNPQHLLLRLKNEI